MVIISSGDNFKLCICCFFCSLRPAFTDEFVSNRVIMVWVFLQASGARGEALIRPSSKGSDRLSLTWMWVEGEFLHTDIQVGRRDRKSPLARFDFVFYIGFSV